jgi:hypothetical protein
MGARQVGKTTLAQMISRNFERHIYFNWDIDEHRELILSGQRFIENIFPINIIGSKPLVIFDELHKYKNWKNFIKGFFDLYKDHYKVIVSGSAHLNVFQKGGDSIMGRYIPYTIHPFSIGEFNTNPIDKFFKAPQDIAEIDFAALYKFGGFPIPFLNRDEQVYNQWKRTRRLQLFREDMRDLTNIHEISQLELCAQILGHQSGCILNRSTIAKKLQVSIQTIGRWVEVLKQFYYAFTIKPWSKNIPNSLIKEPKVYLHDWASVSDEGARFENFIACHLKKSIDFWTESGLGEFELYFLRDKKQREVDFLITRDQEPWIMIEAKTAVHSISHSMHYYLEQLKTPFAFQVTKNMDYVNTDCFAKTGAFIVPAKTLLSQLI